MITYLLDRIADVIFYGLFRVTGLATLWIGSFGRISPGQPLHEVLADPEAKRHGFTYHKNGDTFLYSDYVPLLGVAIWVGTALLVGVIVIVHSVAAQRSTPL